MPGREFSAGNEYRYGFNGKENDNDVKGDGNEQDYGMRIYDPRLGRFLSFDPLTRKYPWLSVYQFASNNPIRNIDVDGGEGPPEKEGQIEEDHEEGSESDEEDAIIRRDRIWKYEEKLKEQANRRAEKEEKEEDLRNPSARRGRELVRTTLQRWARNAIEVAPSVFGEPPTTVYRQLTINKGNGSVWENAVYQSLLANPNYQNVARQVTLVVTGTLKDGKTLTARVRIDCAAITEDLSIHLYEAKYSIEEITVDNVKQTLTTEQGKLGNIFQTTDNITFQVKGKSLESSGIFSNTDITTNIKSVTIVVPQGSAKPAPNAPTSVKSKTNTTSNKSIKRGSKG